MLLVQESGKISYVCYPTPDYFLLFFDGANEALRRHALGMNLMVQPALYVQRRSCGFRTVFFSCWYLHCSEFIVECLVLSGVRFVN